jgi:hypothetical protein
LCCVSDICSTCFPKQFVLCLRGIYSGMCGPILNSWSICINNKRYHLTSKTFIHKSNRIKNSINKEIELSNTVETERIDLSSSFLSQYQRQRLDSVLFHSYLIIKKESKESSFRWVESLIFWKLFCVCCCVVPNKTKECEMVKGNYVVGCEGGQLFQFQQYWRFREIGRENRTDRSIFIINGAPKWRFASWWSVKDKNVV